MELDRVLLEQHASYTADGVEERAFLMPVADGQCLALLYRPVGEARGLGFVVCHSYALELLTLRRTERGVARALAAAGHPVLAFHRRGYGDSSGSLDEAGLDWHLEDTRAALEWLRAEAGLTETGLIGARFGGLIAGLVAREGGVDRLILMNPATSAESYFRKMIKEMHVVQLSIRDDAPRRSTEELLEEMRATGSVDVLGFPIHGVLYEPLQGADLASDVGGFGGKALLIQVAKRTAPGRELQGLREALERGGADVRVELIREPAGSTFGGVSYVSTGDPMQREDVLAPVVERISQLAGEWVRT